MSEDNWVYQHQNNSGSKITSILHGSLTTRWDSMAKDNWGLSGVWVGYLVLWSHGDIFHIRTACVKAGWINHSPRHSNLTSLVLPSYQTSDGRQATNNEILSIWNQYCGTVIFLMECDKFTYVTWPYVLVIDGWRGLSFNPRVARLSFFIFWHR